MLAERLDRPAVAHMQVGLAGTVGGDGAGDQFGVLVEQFGNEGEWIEHFRPPVIRQG